MREIDALGGLMGLAADATFLQSRMLNRGKGPAVHSLRVQTDRARYHIWMKHALEQTPNLFIHQAEVTGLKVEGGRVCGVCTNLGGYYGCRAVVIATGTSLGGRIFIGEANYAGGPDGSHAATALTEDLVGWASRCAGSKPAPRPGCTAAALILPSLNASPATPTRACSRFRF